MRQFFLVLSILLLGLTWSVAQSGNDTQGSSTSSSPSAGQSGTAGQSGSTGYGQTETGTGNHMTVEGCLSGSAGSYTLTDKNGATYQLTGDTAMLSEHVGHEIKVTGTAAAGAAASESSESSAGGTGTAGAGQALHVTSVKHIAKTCKSAGGGMSH